MLPTLPRALRVRRASMSSALLCATWIAVSGCASVPAIDRERLARAESLVHERPAEALALLSPIVETHPKHIRAHELKAVVLEELGRDEEALREYSFLIHTDQERPREDILRSHRGFGRVSLRLLGPVPQRSKSAPPGIVEERIAAALASFESILAGDPHDLPAQYGAADCTYRLGRLADAMRMVEPHEGGDDVLGALAQLVRENLVGVTPDGIRDCARVVRQGDAAGRALAAEHLVWLSGQSLDRRSRLELDAAFDDLAGAVDLPAEILERLATVREQSEQRRSEEEAEQLVAASRRRRESGDWVGGWELLQEARRLRGGLETVLIDYVHAWGRKLLDDVASALAEDSLESASAALEEYDGLPAVQIPGAVQQRHDELVARLDALRGQRALGDAFERADSAIARRQGLEALQILDAIEAQVPPDMRVEFDLRYVRGLSLWGRADEALSLLEKMLEGGALDDRRESPVFRLYGVLLQEAGRSAEAQRVLEELPLDLFNSEAYTALIKALEDQGAWEAVLARLQKLSFVPAEYHDILIHCATAAARRRLRSGDPRAARLVLEAYLDERDRQLLAVQEVMVQIHVDANELDRATDVIVAGGNDLIDRLPPELLDRLQRRASAELREDQLFRLYSRIAQRSTDPELQRTLERLWPKFGSYLPKPGLYTYQYTIRRLGPDGETLNTERESMRLEWQDDHFSVLRADGRTENWREQDGNWIIEGPGHEQTIPVRAVGRPPYDVRQFKVLGVLWSAQVIEAATEVEVGGTRYAGCLKVRLINEENQEQYRDVYLAPHVGRVLQEDYSFSEVIRMHELMSIAHGR